MGAAAWDGFLNDQDNWPAASRAEASKGSMTTARDTLGDRTFIKRKRMSQEERHLQILGRRQDHRDQRVLGHVVAGHLR